MANPEQSSSFMLFGKHCLTSLILAFAFALILMAQPMRAQTFSVLHYFTGDGDGGNPSAGVTIGGPGLLYGTAEGGGIYGHGTAYKLSEKNTNWILSPLHEFTNGRDGGFPAAGLVGLNGALYGTTYEGGAGGGTVYELRPPPTVCKAAFCYWDETVLYSFSGFDGINPVYGNVTFDHAGNIYGTASEHGLAQSCGTVWELTPSSGGWVESVLYAFTGGADGCNPQSGVIFDPAGNLYGNTGYASGGVSGGTVYELGLSSGTWVERTLATLNESTGDFATGTLTMDASGNLYGTTESYGPNGSGTVYELSPSNGGWIFSLVYAFGSASNSCGSPAGVTLGPDGNLYGVCYAGGANNDGWVFQMPPNCDQTCTPRHVHDFDRSDGWSPFGPVVFDASGNLYGTTIQGGIMGTNCAYGGAFGCGVVWEITGVANTTRH